MSLLVVVVCAERVAPLAVPALHLCALVCVPPCCPISGVQMAQHSSMECHDCRPEQLLVPILIQAQDTATAQGWVGPLPAEQAWQQAH